MNAPEPVIVRTGHVRWFVCALLFAIVALNYTDRQVLSVLKPTLQQAYGWSEVGYGDVVFWFQAAYGLGYVCFGRVVDRYGAKVGGTIAVTVWTIAHIAHAIEAASYLQMPQNHVPRRHLDIAAAQTDAVAGSGLPRDRAIRLRDLDLLPA